MGRYLSVTPIDQPQQQLGVRFYSMWYYIQSGVGILARKKEVMSMTLTFYVSCSVKYTYSSNYETDIIEETK